MPHSSVSSLLDCLHSTPGHNSRRVVTRESSIVNNETIVGRDPFSKQIIRKNCLSSLQDHLMKHKIILCLLFLVGIWGKKKTKQPEDLNVCKILSSHTT